MTKYYSNYLGICLQNNDPEKRGRIKIFVPHISASLYTNWNQNIEDKVFSFLGDDTNPDLQKVITELKNVLPWAECAAPIFGGSSSGRYNALTKKGSISSSNKRPAIQLIQADVSVPEIISSGDKHNTDEIKVKQKRSKAIKNNPDKLPAKNVVYQKKNF